MVGVSVINATSYALIKASSPSQLAVASAVIGVGQKF